MLAYKLEKYYTQNNYYAHLGIHIYKHDGYKWTEICNITWQNDKENNEWYAFRLQSSNSLDRFVFGDYIKFLQKVEKAGVFGNNPVDFIVWLSEMRGMKQLVYDNRLQDDVLIEDYEKTRQMDAFKVYVNGQYILKVLAYSENHAETIAFKAMANGELYNWKTCLQNWNSARFEKVYADFSDIPDIQEFLTPIWNK